MNLEDYRQFVRSRALNHDGELFYNESIDHASIVVENLFAYADKRVDVLSGTFNPRVYGKSNVIQEAALFLATSDENRLRILLEQDFAFGRTHHPFFQAFKNFPSIELRYVPQDLQDNLQYHFILTDKNGYRFEQDKRLPAAVAAFGDSTGATILDREFSDLWQKCKPIEIIPNNAD